MIGKDFTQQLLSEYRQRAEKSKTGTPIVETQGNSPDREVNRYDKPVIIFTKACEKFGKEKIIKFLKAFYIRFAEAGHANTATFLDEIEKQIGTDAKEYFTKAINGKNWKEIEAGL
jgi:hypothetical protein